MKPGEHKTVQARILAYARRIYVDTDFQKKTNALVQQHIGAIMDEPPADYV